MAAHLGAHETMEVHEILNHTIDTVNHFQMLRPYAKDQRLMQMVDRQLSFITNEYNGMVQALNQQGQGQAIPYRAPKNFSPVYGLDNPAEQSPNQSMNQMDDRDVASAMLGCHKSSALMKMMASLECADPQLRHMMQQGAMNCSEQAYEVWQYMNQSGFYQVPTMKEMTTNTVLDAYQPSGYINAANTMQTQQSMPAPNYMNQ